MESVAVGNKAMNRTEALEDANLKIALAASMSPTPEAPGGSIFRDVLTDPDLAPLVLGALVQRTDDKRDIVLGRWLCSFWARDLALWESLCHLRWPATKQLKGVENHRTLFFNRFCCDYRLPRQVTLAPANDLQFIVKCEVTEDDNTYSTLLEAVLQGADASSTKACAHFWPNWTNVRDVGVCWDVTPDLDLLAKLGLGAGDGFETRYETWLEEPDHTMRLSIDVFRASDQKTANLAEVEDFDASDDQSTLEKIEFRTRARAGLTCVGNAALDGDPVERLVACLGPNADGDGWQFCFDLQITEDYEHTPDLTMARIFALLASANDGWY